MKERVMTDPKQLVSIELKNAGFDIDAINVLKEYICWLMIFMTKWLIENMYNSYKKVELVVINYGIHKSNRKRFGTYSNVSAGNNKNDISQILS